jgi:hypothetical protein
MVARLLCESCGRESVLKYPHVGAAVSMVLCAVVFIATYRAMATGYLGMDIQWIPMGIVASVVATVFSSFCTRFTNRYSPG